MQVIQNTAEYVVIITDDNEELAVPKTTTVSFWRDVLALWINREIEIPQCIDPFTNGPIDDPYEYPPRIPE